VRTDRIPTLPDLTAHSLLLKSGAGSARMGPSGRLRLLREKHARSVRQVENNPEEHRSATIEMELFHMPDGAEWATPRGFFQANALALLMDAPHGALAATSGPSRSRSTQSDCKPNIHVPKRGRCVSLFVGRRSAPIVMGPVSGLSIRLRGETRVAGLSVVRRRSLSRPDRAS